MSRVIHFELGAEDPERASRFYTEAFGWQFHQWAGESDYWLITTGAEGEPGIDGGMSRRSDQPEPWVNVIGVDSIEEAVAKVEAAGGKVVAPKQPIPGVGYAAYCVDTEGNRFGLYQDDPTAAATG